MIPKLFVGVSSMPDEVVLVWWSDFTKKFQVVNVEDFDTLLVTKILVGDTQWLASPYAAMIRELRPKMGKNDGMAMRKVNLAVVPIEYTDEIESLLTTDFDRAILRLKEIASVIA